MIRRALFGAVVLVGLLAAPASAQYVDIIVSPTQVAPGGQVTVTGKACAAGSTVTIYLIAGDQTATYAQGATPPVPAGTVVATLMADATGDFTTTFTVPADTQLGLYTVVTVCGDFTDAQVINVVGQPANVPAGTPAGTGSGNLPRTGSNLNGMGLVGAGLLAAGGLVLIGIRRRRDERPTLA